MRVPLPTVLWLVLAAACSYGEFSDDGTVFKCDPQNRCPDDHYCSTNHVCIENGTVGCAGQPLSRVWSFNRSVEEWQFEGQEGLTLSFEWTSMMGRPALGALQASIEGTPSTMTLHLAHFSVPFEYPPQPAEQTIDMRGQIFSAQVWTDTPDQSIKISTGDPSSGVQTYAYGAAFSLMTNDWTCVSFNFDAPGTQQASYDASRISGLELALIRSEPAQLPLALLLDDAGY